MRKERVGFALCGSFCTHARVLEELERLCGEYETVLPIASEACQRTDTRFGKADEWKARLKEVTGKDPMTTLVEVEPIGPKGLFDVLVVAPCTGTTLARLANGLSDTPVSLAVKSHLRRSRPVVLAVSTNDALGASMRNIALLKNTKHIYFVPMSQDDPTNKPNSLVADFTKIEETITAALSGVQIQPLFL